jgi:hypothetical protein
MLGAMRDILGKLKLEALIQACGSTAEKGSVSSGKMKFVEIPNVRLNHG